jgi:hypothetical protein
MGRGGHREKAGRKPGWKHSETQTIRVPKVFATQLLEYARRLDSGEGLELVQMSPEPAQDLSLAFNPDQIDIFSYLSRSLDSETDSTAPNSEASFPLLESVTDSNIPPKKPDELRWLSSRRAHQVAVERGCLRNLEGFRKWAKRNSDKCLQDYSLRRLPSLLTGDNSAPAFEDVQYGISQNDDFEF